MDWRTYRKMTGAEMMGCKVLLRREIHNGNILIPKGTEATIERKWGGLTLISDPCVTCGVRIYITKVHPADVQLMRVKGVTSGE